MPPMRFGSELAQSIRLGYGRGRRFNPLTALWPNGEAGLWLQARDLSTAFQDNAGTTPGAVGQSVGLRLDKRLSPTALGAVTGWTNSSWDTFAGNGGGFVASKDIAGGTDSAYSSNTFPVTLNVWYRVELVVSVATVANYTVNLSSTTNSRSTAATLTGTGTKVCYVLANVASGNFSVAVNTTATGALTVDSVSVSEVRGNHVSQATATARPVLQQPSTYVDRLDGGDDGYGTAAFAAGALTVNMDAFISVKRNSTARGVLAYKTAGSSPFFGYYESASASSSFAGVGAPSVLVNGAALGGTTAGDLHTALPNGTWKLLELHGLDLSAWTAFAMGAYTSFVVGADLAEVILCPAQSDAVRAQVRTYMGAAVSLSL